MNVLVTGSAACLAKVLIPRLLDHDSISQVIGVDLRQSTLQHPKYQEHILDIRSPQLAGLLTTTDTVIHLAFIVNSGTLGAQRFDLDHIYSNNVEGSCNVFELARQQKVASIIHLSSAVVYGINGAVDSGTVDNRTVNNGTADGNVNTSTNNPSYMTESQPLQSIPGFHYSEHKVAVEQWLDAFETLPHAPRVVRLRPHAILGENAQPLLKQLLAQPFSFSFPDPQPLTQCVWEQDVATAIVNAALNDNVHGSYNLATDEVASFHFIHHHVHKYSIPMPHALLKQLHKFCWRYTGALGEPGWMASMQQGLTVDNAKAQQDLSWRPTLNLFECLDATL